MHGDGHWLNGVWIWNVRINHDLLESATRSEWEELQNILINVSPNMVLADAFV